MAELGIYEQKPPRLAALEWDGSRKAAAWIVGLYGGTMHYEANQNTLRHYVPDLFDEVIPPGTWFAVHPVAGVMRLTAEELAASWEYVEPAPAGQQPTEPDEDDPIDAPNLDPVDPNDPPSGAPDPDPTPDPEPEPGPDPEPGQDPDADQPQ